MSNVASVATPAPVREKEVIDQSGYLRESVAILKDTFERLAPAISEVLSDSPPEVSDTKETAVKVLCPLANYLREIRYDVEGMDSHLRHVLDRVEV